MTVEEPTFDVKSFFSKFQIENVPPTALTSVPSASTATPTTKGLTAAEIEQMTVAEMAELGFDEVVGPIDGATVREQNIEEIENQLNLMLKIENKAEQEKRNLSKKTKKLISFVAVMAGIFFVGQSILHNKSVQ